MCSDLDEDWHTLQKKERLIVTAMGEGWVFRSAAARPPPFSLILFPFRPSIIGLFGVLLQKNRDSDEMISILFWLLIVIATKWFQFCIGCKLFLAFVIRVGCRQTWAVAGRSEHFCDALEIRQDSLRGFSPSWSLHFSFCWTFSTDQNSLSQTNVFSGFIYG